MLHGHNRGRGMRLFLTGNPGVGKTTLIRAIVERLKGITCAGFYTVETRQARQRTGFKIVTLNDREGILASVGTQKPTVGKYSIHVADFERLVLRYLDPAATSADLYVIDEIGRMELLSHQFRTRIVELLAQPTNPSQLSLKEVTGLLTKPNVEATSSLSRSRERTAMSCQKN